MRAGAEEAAGPRVVGAAELARALPVRAAVDALRAALRGGLDVAAGPARSRVPMAAGELLLMPAEFGTYAGVKAVGVAPGNPARGMPSINGAYLLFDAATLRPVAVLDGAALTLLRTSAVSALAADHLATADAARLVVLGTGPQAFAHATALAAVRPLTSLEVVGRDPARVRDFVERCAETGLPAVAATTEAVAGADLIACCTSAHTPLFDGAALAGHATVIAMGSHTTEAREVDTTTVARSTVIIEDHETALREAGDVTIPVAEGAVRAEDFVPLQALVTGEHTPDPARPRLFKGTGMAWQDLVVAAAAAERLGL